MTGGNKIVTGLSSIEPTAEKKLSKFLCKDCKHSFIPPIDYPVFFFGLGRDAAHYVYRCKLTKEETVDWNPVTGVTKKRINYNYCHWAREAYGPCTIEAKNWAPRKEKHIFLALSR